MFKISITISNEYQDMLRRREATDYIDWTFGVFSNFYILGSLNYRLYIVHCKIILINYIQLYH